MWCVYEFLTQTSVDITAPPVVPGNMAASRPTHFMRYVAWPDTMATLHLVCCRGRLQPSLFSGERNVGTFVSVMGGGREEGSGR